MGTDHLDELKQRMTEGVGKLPFPTPTPPPQPPKWIGNAGPNPARAAQVSASGHYDLNLYPVSNINDGRSSYTDNRLRWVSDPQVPDKVELMWDQPQTIGAVRLVTGQSGGNEGPRTPTARFVLQYRMGPVIVTFQRRGSGNSRSTGRP